MLYTHLAGRINGGMTSKQCHHNSNLTEKPSNKPLRGQVSKEKVLALQVEGQDATWMTIKRKGIPT